MASSSSAREYRELLAQHGFIYSNTSPYYPQSNGKLEKFHDSLKNELLGGKEMTGFEYAERLIDRLIDCYNEVRLHGAIGYVTPRDMLEGRAPAVQAERERKLKDARERRRLANKEMKIKLKTHRETEDGSAGEQPSRDGDVTERRWPCRRANRRSFPKTVYAGCAMPRKTPEGWGRSPKSSPQKRDAEISFQ